MLYNPHYHAKRACSGPWGLSRLAVLTLATVVVLAHAVPAAGAGAGAGAGALHRQTNAGAGPDHEHIGGHCKAYLADPSGDDHLHRGRHGAGQPANGPSPIWPPAKVWAELNSTSGGRLIRPTPPGAACHPEFVNPGETSSNGSQQQPPQQQEGRCAEVAAQWKTMQFHAANPASPMWNQYANDTCLPDPGAPCSGAGYPAYVLDADNVEVVKLGVDFARKHNMRLNVKSTGHDYQGRSTQPGSLSIWIHHLQGFEVHDTFKPQGCASPIPDISAVVTAKGGTQMGTLYSELDKLGLAVVGGGSSLVGVGGYVTGGGHSILAPRFGMAADQVLEMEVVLASGEVVVANECLNEDLFWAMRGGGGSTFGIMTSVTMIAHPSPKLVSYDVVFGTPDYASPNVPNMFGYILSQYPDLDNKGISGYGSFISALKITIPTATQDGAGTGTGNDTTSTTAGTAAEAAAAAGPTEITVAGGSLNFILVDATDPAEISAIMDPILNHLLSSSSSPSSDPNSSSTEFPNQVFTLAPPTIISHPSFYSWFLSHDDPSLAGDNMFVGSHLLDAKAMTDEHKLSEAYRTFAKTSGTGYLVVGNGTRNAKPRGGGNAVNPSFRKALSHSTNGINFEPLNPAARAQALVELNAKIQPLRDLAPDMGSYVNENNPAEPDWQHSFWGENYPRLLSIKRRIDPHDVFWCHPCVGNERWEERGYRLCRKEAA